MGTFNSTASERGQTSGEPGSAHRGRLTKHMIEAARDHFNGLRGVDMSRYDVERRHSNYPDSKSDLVIYNTEDQAVLRGREFHDGRMAFWRN
jgi:hypothetical protein